MPESRLKRASLIVLLFGALLTLSFTLLSAAKPRGKSGGPVKEPSHDAVVRLDRPRRATQSVAHELEVDSSCERPALASAETPVAGPAELRIAAGQLTPPQRRPMLRTERCLEPEATCIVPSARKA